MQQGRRVQLRKAFGLNSTRFTLLYEDGAFSFANEVPGVFENAKHADGFVKITDLKASHRTRVPASICEECRTVMLKY